jgi:GxxExxY protein
MDVDIKRVDDLRRQVIGCAIEVHRRLGPGLLESVYSDCMVLELRHHGLAIDTDRHVPIIYRGEQIRADLEIDIIVEEMLILELKAVAAITRVHVAQVITYLKLANCPAGLLLNFNVTLMKDGTRRLEHPDLYRKPSAAVDSVPDRTPDGGAPELL